MTRVLKLGEEIIDVIVYHVTELGHPSSGLRVWPWQQGKNEP
jgi:hypothetical protein